MANKKIAIAGIFFIILMFGSTIAYVVLMTTNSNNNQPTLPSSKILTSELPSSTEIFMISSGYILIKFNYNINCSENCTELRTFLEGIATSQQTVYLEELTLNATSEPSVQILTSSGALNVQNATVDSVTNNLCNLNIPLTECALKNV